MERTAPNDILHNAPCANDQLNETNAVAKQHWLKSRLPSENRVKERNEESN